MQRAIITSLGLCAALLLGVLAQQNRLATLRNECSHVFAQTSSRAEVPSPVASDKAPRATQAADSPSLELLKLRADVARLSNRKRELASAAVENANLHTQLATRGTNAPGTVALPPGYIKKSEARFVGYATPEETIQSLLWAIQNRDSANFLRAFETKAAQQFEARMQSLGSADLFFKEAAAFPGMHIVGREGGTGDEVALMVQVMPGQEPQRLHFKQFDGQWKLVSGF